MLKKVNGVTKSSFLRLLYHKDFMTHRLRIILSLLMLLAAPIGVCCQVNFCYQFDDCAGNSRPAGWGALPNLDFNYVGVLAYDNTAISGAHSLHIKGNVCYQ